MKLRSALLMASILALPAAAIAQPVTGPYVSLGVGANIFQDQTVKTYNIPEFGASGANPGRIQSEVTFGGFGGSGGGFDDSSRAIGSAVAAALAPARARTTTASASRRCTV